MQAPAPKDTFRNVLATSSTRGLEGHIHPAVVPEPNIVPCSLYDLQGHDELIDYIHSDTCCSSRGAPLPLLELLVSGALRVPPTTKCFGQNCKLAPVNNPMA